MSINLMHLWFEYLWEERCNEKGQIKCYECGKIMNRNTWKEYSTCYSHIYPKSTYPLLKGNEENVVITHPDCHFLYETTPKKAKNQYALKLKLGKKYNKL